MNINLRYMTLESEKEQLRKLQSLYGQEKKHRYGFDKNSEPPDLRKMSPRQLEEYRQYVEGINNSLSLGNSLDLHGNSIHEYFRSEVLRVMNFKKRKKK